MKAWVNEFAVHEFLERSSATWMFQLDIFNEVSHRIPLSHLGSEGFLDSRHDDRDVAVALA